MWALVAAIAAGALPSGAHTVTLNAGPFDLHGFQTSRPRLWVRTPRLDGYVVRMRAQLVDARGRQAPIGRVMLHHVLFWNGGRSGRDGTTSCPGRVGESFFGTGEEHQRLVLPPGYGYRVRATDRWRMQTMLMNHSLRPGRVWVRYTVTVVTGRRLTPVKPLWLRANGCVPEPSYVVPGTGRPRSRHYESALARMPLNGRIVAAGGHLHGGAYALRVSQPRCGGRTLFEHRPLFGRPADPVYHVHPALHEPGPIATGYFVSGQGIPVRRGESLRVTGVYDDEVPHMRVMAITHVYVARDDHAPRGCAPLPEDRRTLWTRTDGRRLPPKVTVPLSALDERGRVVSIARPSGGEVVHGAAATVDLAGGRFGPANLSVALGARVTWRFRDGVRHNILLASGPRAVGSPTLGRGGRYTKRFVVPGTYKLFCYLHPVTMSQVLTVRG